MEILTVNFDAVQDVDEENLGCILIDLCGDNSCDCEYNCATDDDCTYDHY